MNEIAELMRVAGGMGISHFKNGNPKNGFHNKLISELNKAVDDDVISECIKFMSEEGFDQ